MADRNVVNTSTGEKGSVKEEQFNRARAAGAREMTDREATALLEQKRHAQDYWETQAALGIGQVRGVGEAFGVPVDKLAVETGELFGKGDETRAYLNDLQKWHPLASGVGELEGQVGGSVAGGELLGGSRAATVAGRVVQGAARGGLENLVIGSTHDINESELGPSGPAGEKILAQMPKHFAMGALPGLVVGGAGEALEAGFSAFQRKAPGALAEAADAAIGREFGGSAELGAEIRGKVGGVPRSSGEVVEVLAKEQAGFRQASQAEATAARDTLLGKQVAVAGEQTARHEAGRVATAKEGREALESLASQHQAAREALNAQHGEASAAAVKLESELAESRGRLRNLAGELDKVKGAELPTPSNITRAAAEAFQSPSSLTPPSPRAVELFQEWTSTFSQRYAEPGSLTFRELQGAIKSLETMETRQRVVSGWGSDPEVKRAFDALRSAAKAEFDRASEATAGAVSEAKGLSAARLRDSIPNLEKAHQSALDNVDTLQRSILDFEKNAVGEMRLAEREVLSQAKQFERTAKGEAKALSQAQRAEERGLPKASKATPVDTLLGRVRSKAEPQGMGGLAMGGALVSLLHGNVAGAAMSVLGGAAASTARAHGNLLAARTLRALSESIAASDGQIAKLAGRAVGRYVRQAPEVATEERPKRKELTFEKVSKAVKDAAANPLIIEQRVRAVAGPWMQQAPGVYSSLLASSIRMQDFLASKLPPGRADPYSLTPHLEPDELSDTEKYDFVQYARAAADPIQAMRDVVDGKGSPEQVEAVVAVYPGIYKQTRAEVQRRLAELQSPLEYERAVNIGTLLQVDTTEVMTGEFQSMQSDMYMARANSEKLPGGSQPRGVNSRLSKSMTSEGQRIATGITE